MRSTDVEASLFGRIKWRRMRMEINSGGVRRGHSADLKRQWGRAEKGRWNEKRMAGSESVTPDIVIHDFVACSGENLRERIYGDPPYRKIGSFVPLGSVELRETASRGT